MKRVMDLGNGWIIDELRGTQAGRRSIDTQAGHRQVNNLHQFREVEQEDEPATEESDFEALCADSDLLFDNNNTRYYINKLYQPLNQGNNPNSSTNEQNTNNTQASECEPSSALLDDYLFFSQELNSLLDDGQQVQIDKILEDDDDDVGSEPFEGLKGHDEASELQLSAIEDSFESQIPDLIGWRENEDPTMIGSKTRLQHNSGLNELITSSELCKSQVRSEVALIQSMDEQTTICSSERLGGSVDENSGKQEICQVESMPKRSRLSNSTAVDSTTLIGDSSSDISTTFNATEMSSSESSVNNESLPQLNKYRRRTANARERTRMREINRAFEKLKNIVPIELIETSCNRDPSKNQDQRDSPRQGKSETSKQNEPFKLTKITTLRLAVSYISRLSELLSESQTGEMIRLTPNNQTNSNSAGSKRRKRRQSDGQTKVLKGNSSKPMVESSPKIGQEDSLGAVPVQKKVALTVQVGPHCQSQSHSQQLALLADDARQTNTAQPNSFVACNSSGGNQPISVSYHHQQQPQAMMISATGQANPGQAPIESPTGAQTGTFMAPLAVAILGTIQTGANGQTQLRPQVQQPQIQTMNGGQIYNLIAPASQQPQPVTLTLDDLSGLSVIRFAQQAPNGIQQWPTTIRIPAGNRTIFNTQQPQASGYQQFINAQVAQSVNYNAQTTNPSSYQQPQPQQASAPVRIPAQTISPNSSQAVQYEQTKFVCLLPKNQQNQSQGHQQSQQSSEANIRQMVATLATNINMNGHSQVTSSAGQQQIDPRSVDATQKPTIQQQQTKRTYRFHNYDGSMMINNHVYQQPTTSSFLVDSSHKQDQSRQQPNQQVEDHQEYQQKQQQQASQTKASNAPNSGTSQRSRKDSLSSNCSTNSSLSFGVLSPLSCLGSNSSSQTSSPAVPSSINSCYMVDKSP